MHPLATQLAAAVGSASASLQLQASAAVYSVDIKTQALCEDVGDEGVEEGQQLRRDVAIVADRCTHVLPDAQVAVQALTAHGPAGMWSYW